MVIIDLETLAEQLEKQQNKLWEEIKQKCQEDLRLDLMRVKKKKQKILKELQSFKENTKFLIIPKNFPIAYQESQKELERRKVFGQAVNLVIKRLQKVCHEERDRREVFNKKYGVFIPKNLFPELNDQIPQFHVQGVVQ